MAIFALKGLWRGFIRESLGLAALGAGLLVLLLFGEAAARWGAERYSITIELARLGGYALCFIVPFGIGQVLAHLGQKAGRAAYLGGIDRFSGALFGALMGALLAGSLLAAADHFGWGSEYVDGSRIAAPLKELFARVMNAAADFWRETALNRKV